MGITIAVILLVLLIGYYWLSKGAFAALLHLGCVLVAGAIAFAAWEPLSMALLGVAGTGFLQGIVWTVGLLVPFAAAVALLRLAVDKFVPGNLHQTGVVDVVGGGLFGLASGVVVTGMVVIALGYARVPAGFGGYRPVFHTEARATGGGSLVRTGMVYPPVDRIVGGLYGMASRGTLATSTPLARWRPDVELSGPAVRISPAGGTTRTAITPEQFSVDNRYRIGGPEQPMPANELLALPDGSGAQPYLDVGGEPVTSGYIEGFVITFDAAAKEGGGDFIFGPGQVQLVAESADGDNAVTIFPFAMVSQAVSENADLFGRWRFEQGDFISSVGGASSFPAAFEFLVPAGYTPLALYVKNTRVRLDDIQPGQTFGSASQRDRSVTNGGIFSGATSRVENLDRSRATAVAVGQGTNEAVRLGSDIGSSFNATNPRGMELNDDNQIIGGSASFYPSELNPRGVDPSLLVRTFAVGADRAVVQVNVSNTSPAAMQGPVVRGLDADATPRLVDSQGVAYEPIGYIYEDRSKVEIRFTPGDPIASRNALPPLSATQNDQTLRLIFVVSSGVTLTDYAVGDTSILRFQPPLVATPGRN